mgnify:CR=1 FL=1
MTMTRSQFAQWRVAALRICRRRGRSLARIAFRCRLRRRTSDLPGRVGRVADIAGQILLVAARIVRTNGSRSASTIRSRPASTCGFRADGRAEVDYGGGQFRLAGDTNVHVSRLDDRQLALFIAQGRLIVRVRAQDPGEATRIDTPNAQVTLTRPGSIASTSRRIGRRPRLSCARAKPKSRSPNEAAAGASGPDRCASPARDARHLERAVCARASTASTPGARIATGATSAARLGDLRVAARWSARRSRPSTDRGRPTPEYGPVWFPNDRRAGLGALPRRLLGRGRRHGGRRGWTARHGATRRSTTVAGRSSAAAGDGVPAGYIARPVWAPALVAWYGGPGWGLRRSRRRPLYGWVPLGWREAVLPRLAPMLVQLLGAVQPALRST